MIVLMSARSRSGDAASPARPDVSASLSRAVLAGGRLTRFKFLSGCRAARVGWL
ncbi:hypothetical protein MET9862_05647 [Methylobacterium symbioticum]|jgi:hypothetical protein|uniref:Uncharacterized protein n=1 Tax=Methylobacterium symbioticum TaxID=2584084 RepID=A0A509ELF0_9HYPH|nr:hypothetical protein MET9862_05647 [Methylobacterium symbioticum]